MRRILDNGHPVLFKDGDDDRKTGKIAGFFLVDGRLYYIVRRDVKLSGDRPYDCTAVCEKNVIPETLPTFEIERHEPNRRKRLKRKA